MDMKTPYRLLISLLAVLAFGGVLSYSDLALLSYRHSAFLASLVPDFLRNILMLLFAFSAIAVSTVLLASPLAKAYRTRQAQQDAQRRQQETLHVSHAIARNLPNGRVFVLDRNLRYVFVEGQPAHDNLELQPEAMLGRTISAAYPREVSQTLETLARSALAGDDAEREIVFQQRNYKVFATPLPDENGLVQRCLLLSQDITPFKESQQQLEILNCQLQRQAASDGLLGIANRREFERVLELEWQRALRERQPLSLLMVDVDNFKLYNDTYGHQQGDACLQQVAATLEAAIARPGDLAARYGGEEMAILLPGTGLAGASHMAQRVHDLLAERAISFPGSPVASHVTVSIGVASMLPGSQISAHTLIAQADEGLYAAKANGRNRTDVVPHLRLITSPDEQEVPPVQPTKALGGR